MYDSHTSLQEPDNDTIIWRYMDFTKFVALLEGKCLYFQRLTSLEDPYEGMLTRKTADRMRMPSPGSSEEEAAYRREVAEHNINFMTSMRSIFSVSCWHISPVESDSMWGRYLQSSDGIALRSTFGRFKKSFDQSEHKVYGCKIEYIDHENTDIDEAMAFNWVKYKRLEFENDREFRGIVMTAGLVQVGESVEVDLNALIAGIHVAPSSAVWVTDLVCRLSKRCGVKAEVLRSKLGSGPDYLGCN